MVLLCLCQITLDFYPLSPICSRLEHNSVHVKLMSLYVTRARQVMARISNGFDSSCEFYSLEHLSKTCWNDAVQSRVYVGDKAYIICRHFSSFEKYFDMLRTSYVANIQELNTTCNEFQRLLFNINLYEFGRVLFYIFFNIAVVIELFYFHLIFSVLYYVDDRLIIFSSIYHYCILGFWIFDGP